MLTRRDFIKLMSFFGGAAIAPVRWLGKWAGVQPPLFGDPLEDGEIHEGLLLLPDGAKVPEFVKYPRKGIPIYCGVGENDNHLASTTSFKTDTELGNSVFFPVYTIKNPPAPFVQTDAYLTLHSTEDIYSSTICFGDQNADNERSVWHIAISAYPEFPRPHPLWNSEPVELDGPSLKLDKVDFLPRPGVMASSQLGFTFYWVEEEVFYTLVMEPIPDFQVALDLLSRLERI